MRSRLARPGILAAGVIGLLLSGTPTASANEVGTFVFQGNAILSGPMGYPCMPNDIGTPKCPPNPTTATKSGLKATTKANVNPGGQTRAFGFGGAVCTGAYITGNKAGKTPGALVPCVFYGTGRVDGYCGFSLIKGWTTMRLGTNAYDVEFWGHDIGHKLVLKLKGTKVTGGGQLQGEVTAHVNAVSEFTLGPPPSTTNTCFAKSARYFTIVGEGNYIVKSTLGR